MLTRGVLTPIGGDYRVFIGRPATLVFELLDFSDQPVDGATWTYQFGVYRPTAPDVLMLDLSSTITVTGTYSSTRADNAQRIRVPLTAAQLAREGFSGREPFAYFLDRVDALNEARLATGPFSPQ